MGEFLNLVGGQLWKLFVLWPAWALTPDGRRALFNGRTLRRIVLFVALAAAAIAIARVMPWGASLALSADLVTYLDLTLAALFVSVAGQLGRSLSAARVLLRSRPRVRRGPRPRAVRSRRPARPPASDNDEEPALPLAA